MNRIKELRKERGLTQQELASEIGTTKLTISNWENNKHSIKSDKAQQLADYFGVSTGYLLGYELSSKPISPQDVPERSFWKHKKSEHIYQVVRKAIFESTLEIMVVYEDVTNRELVCRRMV